LKTYSFQENEFKYIFLLKNLSPTNKSQTKQQKTLQ